MTALAAWILMLAVGLEHSQLRSPDFAVRDAAARRLAAFPPWGHLVGRLGAWHPDSEVRAKCQPLLVRRWLYLEAGWRSGGPLGALAAETLTNPQKWSPRSVGEWWSAFPDRLYALDRTAHRLRLLHDGELPWYDHPGDHPLWEATCGVINACRFRYRGEKIPGYGW